MSQTNKLLPMSLALLITIDSAGVVLGDETRLATEPAKTEAAVPVHPVLQVAPNEPLGSKSLEPSLFKKMNGLLKMSEAFKFFEDRVNFWKEKLAGFLHKAVI